MKKFEVTPVLKKYATIVLDIKCYIRGMQIIIRKVFFD